MKATQTVVTDYNVGAVARTLIEAPAIELEELYQQSFNMVTAAIPVSVYKSFNFTALAAIAASGLIRTTIAAQQTDQRISAGTQFATTSTSSVYVASTDTTIAAGDTYADVQVACSATGSAGNLAANQSFTTTPTITGFVSATNLSPFTSGRDAETADQTLQRFNDYISTLPRGTTASLSYGLSTAQVTDSNGNAIETVALSLVDEPYTRDATQPIALVNLYIFNGVGSTSAALVAAAQKIIDGYTQTDGTKVAGYKAAGVPTTVYAATEQDLNFSAELEIDTDLTDWATAEAAATTAIDSYLLGLPFNATAVVAKMEALLMGITGVTDVPSMSLTANVTGGIGVKLMAGTLSFTQAATTEATS
ncbi:baseplate J/gp47 family protein [Pararobbsia silviterrae]|nr:baseplate J/gp47 family protein [Pararobbsia silviterrae]